jgi:hypothetical protein
VAVALSGVVILLGTTVGVAGGAAADPPEQAYENHHNATDGKDVDDNSILDKDRPHAPVPVTLTPLAATVAPEPADLLPCGATITADGKGVNPDVAVTRLTDADKATDADCEAFPYELSSIPNGLRFLKPTGYPLAQFFVDVTWFRPLGQEDDAPTVDFEAVDGGYPVEISDCPVSLRDPETDEVVGLTLTDRTSPEELAALGIVDQDGAPSDAYPVDNGLTQFACVASTNPIFDPWAENGPRWVVKQRLWLLGDVIFRG